MVCVNKLWSINDKKRMRIFAMIVLDFQELLVSPKRAGF